MTDEAFVKLREREKELWAKERAMDAAHKKVTDDWIIVHRQVEHERSKRALIAEIEAEDSLPAARTLLAKRKQLPEVAGQGVES